MKEYQEKLIHRLLEKNDQLSYAQARAWVELLWEDFEATYAKAGEKYRGSEFTLKIVSHWVEQYGSRLHDFVATNPKFKNLLNNDDYLKH